MPLEIAIVESSIGRGYRPDGTNRKAKIKTGNAKFQQINASSGN